MLNNSSPSEDSLRLALELLDSISNKDISNVPEYKPAYFITGSIYDLFDEIKAYLTSLSSSKDKMVNLEAFETLSAMAYNKLKLDLGLAH